MKVPDGLKIFTLILVISGCAGPTDTIRPDDPLMDTESRVLINQILERWPLDAKLVSTNPVSIVVTNMGCCGIVIEWYNTNHITVIGMTFTSESEILGQDISAENLFNFLEPYEGMNLYEKHIRSIH